MGRNRKGQKHFSEVQTGQQSSASSMLGTLLSYPFLWPSSKVLKFLQCAHNKVKPANDQNRDDQIVNFRAKFDAEAVYAFRENWTRKIDSSHFNQYFESRLNKNCGQSALQLLRLIRNIPEHTNEFTKEDMQELQWLSSNNEFDTHLFLLYWTTKFPLFVSFTWLKFSHFLQTSEAFKDYYPACFTVPVDTDIEFKFENFITKLDQGLQDHLEKGGLLKRFEIYTTHVEACILELRSLPDGIIPSILSPNFALQVRFLEEEIHCQWDCIEGGKIVSSALTSYPGDYKSSPLRETLFLLSFNKNHLNILKMRFEGNNAYHPKRIIICTNFENIPLFHLEKSAKHFTEIHNYSYGLEKPLKWGDVTTAVRSTILDKTIKFQRKSMRLRELINMEINNSQELENKLEPLLSRLNGETLRLLLMDKKPDLFSKLTPPSEPPIYVERKLSIEENESSKTGSIITIIKEEDFLEQLDEQRPVIIADKPGMGKTLVLSSFARKLLKFKNRYVLFMHINEFVKRMLLLIESVVTKEKIISALSKLVSITEFEENLVKFWLEKPSGIVFELMLDGRDELSSKPGYNCFVDSFLQILRNKLGGVVRVWITLRGHLMEEIKRSLKVPGYKICPYVKSDQIKFLTEYWLRTFESSDPETATAHSANGELKLFAERCIDSLHSFMKSASTFSNFSKEIAGVPLQCRMLGEIYQSKANQIILGGHVNDISVIEINSVTELYEKMVEAKLEDFLKTKNGLTNIDMNNGLIVGPIRKFATSVHIRLAIKCIFSSKCYEDLDICDALTSRQSQESSESFLPYGLIVDEDPLLFVHRTFAEYFVSLFIHKCLRGDFRHADETSFAKFLVDRIFQVKLEQFFHDPKNQQTKNTSTFMTPVICYFFDTMLNPEVMSPRFLAEFSRHYQDQERKVERKAKKFDCDKSPVVAAIRHDFFNIFKLLIHCSEDFYLASQQEHVFILSIAAQTTRLEFFKYLCVEIENWNGNDEFRIPAEILYSALRRGRFEIVKFLVEERGFGPGTWKGHQVDDKKRYSVIHHCVCKSRRDSKQILENKEQILRYLADLNPSILEEVDSRGRTPLLSQLETSIRLKKKLLEVGANPNAVEVEVKDGNRIYGKYHNSGLHWSEFITYEKGTPPEAYHELLSSFLDHDFDINLQDAVGNTTLHCAIKTYRERILDKTLQLFEANGANFNAKSKSDFYNGGTVLHWVTKKGSNVEFVRKLINHGCSLDEKNKDEMTPLDVALALAESSHSHKALAQLLKHESGQ